MKKVIVTTTINPPTQAIEAFQAMKGWELVVAGDKKTPRDYHLDRGIYITPEEQEKYDPALSEAIGWNCIQRRNFAFLWAMEMKADVVALVDDDNIPLPGWGEDLLVGKEVEVDYYETDLPAFDPIGATNYPNLWHRGYPLQLLSKRDYSRKKRRRVRADVQADFWNGDPDVDALCRIAQAPECTFDPAAFPFAANKPGPFNSQNTFIRGELLKDYFMFPHVGRMDDIWPSYYVQALGYRVVYNRASVYQARNPHDLTRDMRNEYLGYENNLKLITDLANDPESVLGHIPGRTAWAFDLYRRHFRCQIGRYKVGTEADLRHVRARGLPDLEREPDHADGASTRDGSRYADVWFHGSGRRRLPVAGPREELHPGQQQFQETSEPGGGEAEE